MVRPRGRFTHDPFEGFRRVRRRNDNAPTGDELTYVICESMAAPRRPVDDGPNGTRTLNASRRGKRGFRPTRTAARAICIPSSLADIHPLFARARQRKKEIENGTSGGEK